MFVKSIIESGSSFHLAYNIIFTSLNTIMITIFITGGGIDYGSGPHNVIFPAGVTSVPINISLTNDNILEGNEHFILTISPSLLPSGVFVGFPDQARIYIVDKSGKLTWKYICNISLIMYIY